MPKWTVHQLLLLMLSKTCHSAMSCFQACRPKLKLTPESLRSRSGIGCRLPVKNLDYLLHGRCHSLVGRSLGMPHLGASVKRNGTAPGERVGLPGGRPVAT